MLCAIALTAGRSLPPSRGPSSDSAETATNGISFVRAGEKAYGTTKVIHGVGFDIDDGESMVLVGRGVAAKSTLLRMLAGRKEIVRVTSNRVVETATAGALPVREGEDTMSCRGDTLMPGLTEPHTHLSFVDEAGSNGQCARRLPTKTATF